VANTIDPLGGSYFIESLTDEIERQAWDYIHKIDEMGGMIAAIEAAYPQKEIQDAAYQYQQRLEKKEKFMVGINIFQNTEEELPIELLRIDESTEQRQVERLKSIRQKRDSNRHKEALERLRRAAEGDENTMPYIMDAVKAYASLGEIVDTLKEVFGVYEEPIFI